MRVQVYFTPMERRHIYRATKRIVPLKKWWARKQAYLWTCVRSQNAYLKTTASRGERTTYPDLEYYWFPERLVSRARCLFYGALQRPIKWVANHSVAMGYMNTGKRVYYYAMFWLSQIHKQVYIPVPKWLFDGVDSELLAQALLEMQKLYSEEYALEDA